jgi:hypothetical protein
MIVGTVWMILKNNKYKKEWHHAFKPLNLSPGILQLDANRERD